MKQYLDQRIKRLTQRLRSARATDRSFKLSRVGLIVLFLIALIILTTVQAALLIQMIVYSVLTVVFIFLSRRHRALFRVKSDLSAYISLSGTDLARLDLKWEEIPETDRAGGGDHPFASDLDISGEFSLYRLLDSCVSREGSQTLLDWLTDTEPVPRQVEARQEVVASLIPLSALRRRLTLLLYGSPRLQSEPLRDWLDRERPGTVSAPLTGIMTALGLANLALLVLHQLGCLGPWWIAGLALYFTVLILRIRSTQAILEDTAGVEAEVRDLRKVLRYLESYPAAPQSRLASLLSAFQGQDSPSRELGLLDLTLNMTGWRGNLLMGLLLNAFVPWDLYCALLAQRCREKFRHSLPAWLRALAELDALNSLAHYAWLHPETIFPRLDPDQAGLEAAGLGHPLLPPSSRVSNDLHLRGPGQVLLVTGSNMSGKSSWLKTIGINLVLAYAGAPLHASSFRAGYFRLASCINIHDSITLGFSFFYTEVRRLKAILDMLEEAERLPVLFLIDEIFKGTNNRERLIGSRSLIRALARSRGLGMITTHDLELTVLEREIPSLVNFHFREHIEQGRMSFDYLFRPGPCPTTNALRIMRLEGLPLDEETV